MNKVNIFSQDRLLKYAFDNDMDKALLRYEANLKICRSFYIPLHTLEVVLRNKVHNAISHNHSKDWLLKETPLFEMERRKVLMAIKKLKGDKKEIMVPRIIASLSFGFWEHLFTYKYETLWRQDLHKIFQEPPIKFTRKRFHLHIRDIRLLRNRIAHYECIIHGSVEDHYNNLIQCIEWLSPEMAIWTKQADDFHEVLKVYKQEYHDMRSYHSYKK